MRSVSEYSNSFDEHTMGLSDSVDGQFGTIICFRSYPNYLKYFLIYYYVSYMRCLLLPRPER